jgi:Mrp family chromosome partitioning ATPase
MLKRRDKNKKAEPNVEAGDSLGLCMTSGIAVVTYPPPVVAALRRMLAHMMHSQQAPLPATLGLLAALPEEGVTYNALALGVLIANDLGRRCCVLELNWQRPGLAQHVHVENAPGLAAVLTTDAALQDAWLPTAMPNLVLLPSGTLPLTQRPIAARGQALKQVVSSLTRQFEHVLIDLPAITATSDTIPLAGLADACCLVIRRDVTTKGTVKRALTEIDHVPMLGVILNQGRSALPKPLQQVVLYE